jgi:transketolase
MRSLPGMTVCCPGDPYEVECLIKQGIDTTSPIYFRLGKGGESVIHQNNDKIILGKSAIIRQGKDVSIISTSNTLDLAIKWADEIASEGKSATVISMHTVKPIDTESIVSLINKGAPIITLEEHSIIGGLGSAVAEVIADYGKTVRFKRIGVNDEYTHKVGSQVFLRKCLGLTSFGSALADFQLK